MLRKSKLSICCAILSTCFFLTIVETRAETSAEKAVGSTSEKFDLVALAKKARGAVVLIEVFNDEKKPIGSGSGFFASADGLVVTNYHVIQVASSAIVKTSEGNVFPIMGAVYFDRDNDVVLLRTDTKGVPFLPLGRSSNVEIGSRVAVIGSPLGLEGSLSEGIIAAKRELPDRAQPRPTPVLSFEHYPPARNFELPFEKAKWLQITAPISPGSSGSPVLNGEGDVVGIATMVFRGWQSLNFAVPIEIIVAMLQKFSHADEQHQALVTFQQLIGHDAATQNILQNAYNCSPEHEAADKALGRYDPDYPNNKKSVDWEKALKLTKDLTLKFPEVAGAWSVFGDTCGKAGLLSEALSAYEETIRLLQRPFERGREGFQATAWASIGSIYKKMEQPTQAQFAFSQAITLQKKSIDILPTKPEQVYSKEQIKAGDSKKMRESLVLQKAMALNELADYYAEAANIEQAKETYLQAIRENPNKLSKFAESLIDAIAEICVKQDDEEIAFTQLYDAMVLSRREYPEQGAWAALGRAYSNAGDKEASLRCYLRAVKRSGVTKGSKR